MFMQVIHGRVADPAELRTAMDRWVQELAPGADGWLGSTAGVTDDGVAVATARFVSQEAARRNSDRPEQGEWWAQTSKLFTGEVAFADCREVVQMRAGGSDEAGFVQVIQGRAKDVARLRELNEEFAMYADFREDLIGGVIGLHDDDRFTQVAYFTSESAAREGERQEPPPELSAIFQEEMSLLEDVSYLDLRQPWLFSPR